MRIHVLFPKYRPDGHLILSQLALLRALKEAGAATSHEILAETGWVERFDTFRALDMTSLKWDTRLMELETTCIPDKARALFDVRRIRGEVPEEMCAHMCALAYRSSIVSAMVTQADETALQDVFPDNHLSPAMFTRPSLVVSYYRRLQAS